jgi:FkbM family methyltransferase
VGVITRGVRHALPARWQPAARYFYDWARGQLERELFLAVAAVQRGDCVVDVGANLGTYTYALARAGARVEAFEPQSACARVLMAFAADKPAVRVHQVALGDTKSEVNLYIPIVDNRARSGEASLRNVGAAAQERVTIAPLDTFDLPAVSMIKIDVEGAELGVIGGAVDTIRRDRPLLLVEIEQRHHRSPVSEVFARIAELGYQGYFLDASHRVRLISEFDFERYQNPNAVLSKPSAGQYINNFLFEPRDPNARRRRWGV